MSLEHRTEMWWLFHPLTLPPCSHTANHKGIQTILKSPLCSKFPREGFPESASIPPGSEILLEVGPSTLVSSRERLCFLTVLPPLSLPGHKSLQDPIRPSTSLLDPPFLLLFLERFQLSPAGCSQCSAQPCPAPFLPSFPLNKNWGLGGEGA